FQQLSVPVLGVVENMSYFIADDGKEYDLFGKGGAKSMAAKLNLPFLGEVPISTKLRQNSDSGNPTANFEERDASDRLLRTYPETLRRAVEREVAIAAMKSDAGGPVLKVT